MKDPFAIAFILIVISLICGVVLYEILVRTFIPKEKIELQGKKVEQTITKTRTSLSRLVVSLGKKVEKLLPISAVETNEYQEKLLAAGVKVEPITWRSTLVISITIGVAFAAFLCWGNTQLNLSIKIAALVFGGLLGWVAPKYYLIHKTKTRRHEIVCQLPDAMSLIKVMVDAGSSIEQCIREVGNSTSGALADELTRVYREITLDNDSKAALQHMIERCKSSDVAAFCRLLIQAAKEGSAISQTLSEYRRTLRKDEHAHILQQISKMDTKLTLVSMVCYVPVILLIIVAVIFNDLIGLFNNVM